MSDPNIANDSGAPDDPINSAVKHHAATAHQHGGACCGAQTSYIHVYQHAATCVSAQSHGDESGPRCFNPDGGVNSLVNKLPSFDTASSGDHREGAGSNNSPGVVSLQSMLEKAARAVTGGKRDDCADILDKRRRKNGMKTPFQKSAHAYQTSDQRIFGEENGLDSDISPSPVDGESSSATDNDDKDSSKWFEEDIVPFPPKKRLWHGIDGIAVMTFGVMAPLLITVMSMASCPKRITLVLLNHPVETLVEIALLLLIPIANYKVWSSLCRNDIRYSLGRGLLVGISLGTALLISALAFAAIGFGFEEMQASTGTDFSTGFFFIGALALAAAATGVYLTHSMRKHREFPSTRARVIVYTLVGMLLGIAAFASAEARPWYIRIAQRMALSGIPEERTHGLQLLRDLKTERELRMECSDSRAAGIAGLFIALKHSEMSRLYFTVTGKPLPDENSEDFSSMSDEYLRRHVVGAPVKGLTLARSAFNGMVSPDSLSSTINWTFVFRNDSQVNQEARAEIAIPPGAVITGLTVWKGGDPLDATFAASGKAQGNINWINVDHDSPAIISDLGRGRNLFHCYPIAPDEQLKVNIKTVVPLMLENQDSANLTFPRFIATNFGLDGDHSLMLESSNKLLSRARSLVHGKAQNGGDSLVGTLERSQLEHTPLMITALRKADITAVAVPDKIATNMAIQDKKAEAERKKAEEESKRANQQVVLMIDSSRGVQEQVEDVQTVLLRDKEKAKRKIKVEAVKAKWVVRTIKETTTTAPKRLLVVIDGSEGVKEHLPKIRAALAAIPPTVPVSVSVASREDNSMTEPLPLANALAKLDKFNFSGGQDNLKAVIKSAQIAGETEGGAVLWIHGAQPVVNKDIYILSPFHAHPAFHELALDSGSTDTLEYFKNHSEVGPFMPVQRTKNLGEDLQDFFAKWQAGRKEFVVTYSMQDGPPKDAKVLEKREMGELLTLNARKMVDDQIRAKQSNRAARLAVEYQFVSPVSCVAVMGETTETREESPELQGASNGTIGPQGKDATAIMGVNTAGTVRVNNLANLEALLNIITNMVELAGLAVGATIIMHGILLRTPCGVLGIAQPLSPGTRILIGIAIVVGACMVPGLVNWFVASARDANLFS